MFFILSKVFTILLYPLSWVFLLVLLAFTIRKGKYKRKFLIAAVATLYFFSNTFIVDEFLRSWEVKAIQDKDLNHCSTAVVLGGMSGWDGEYNRIQFYSSNDRLMQALRLYKLGKVDQLLITSGSGRVFEQEEKEADFLRSYLKDIQLLDSNMYFENQSRNTHENAAFSKPILEKINRQDTILLVTSGFHMARAIRCFEAVGIPVKPYSTDRMVGNRRFDIELMFLPNTEAHMKWATLFKEWIGISVYRFRGWA